MERPGFCATLGRFFRRALCLENRHGSSDSLSDNHQGAQKIELMPMTIFGKAKKHRRKRAPRDMSEIINLELDMELLNSIDFSIVNVVTGRFLTLNRRKRPRLTTRSLRQDTSLLDDLSNGQLQSGLDGGKMKVKTATDRHFVLQIALKCADISNPCRPWDLSRKWSKKVCEEFFRQGDYERKLKLPVTSMCDRRTTSIPKIQDGFLRFIVTPLVNEWHKFLACDLTAEMLVNLNANQAKWASLLVLEKTRNPDDTDISDSEIVEDDGELYSSKSEDFLIPDVDMFLWNKNKVKSIRHFSIPMDSKAKRDKYHLCRGSFPFMTKNLKKERVDEKIGFRDSDFFFHSSSSIDLNQNDCNVDDNFFAENLFPRHSIATMTSKKEVERISLIIHGHKPAKPFVKYEKPIPPNQRLLPGRYLLGAGERRPYIDNFTEMSSSSDDSRNNMSLMSKIIFLYDNEITDCSTNIKTDNEDDDSNRTITSWSANFHSDFLENKFIPTSDKENVKSKFQLNFSPLRRKSDPIIHEDVKKLLTRPESRRSSAPYINDFYEELRTSGGRFIDNFLNKKSICANNLLGDFFTGTKPASPNRSNVNLKGRKKTSKMQRRSLSGPEIFSAAGILSDKERVDATLPYQLSLNDFDFIHDSDIEAKGSSSLSLEALVKTDESHN